jgi:hypothetical protein
METKPTLEVSPIPGHGVTPAAERMRRYRKGAAHAAVLARKRQERAAKRERWLKEKLRYKTMEFDGRHSGPDYRAAGRLAEFERRKTA